MVEEKNTLVDSIVVQYGSTDNVNKKKTKQEQENSKLVSFFKLVIQFCSFLNHYIDMLNNIDHSFMKKKVPLCDQT
jgi:hypothetical protein